MFECLDFVAGVVNRQVREVRSVKANLSTGHSRVDVDPEQTIREGEARRPFRAAEAQLSQSLAYLVAREESVCCGSRCAEPASVL